MPAAQGELAISGHAIEARLYAEDPGAGFLPVTGVLEHLVFPDCARIDTGVRQGDRITPHYDPMIAKITVHGNDRDAALRAMAMALDRTEVAGTVTNAGFLHRLIAHPGFVAGDLDTGIIDRDLAGLVAAETPSELAVALGAVTAIDLVGGPQAGFTLWAPLRHMVTLGGAEVTVIPVPDGADAIVAGRTFSFRRDGGGWRIDGTKSALRGVRLRDSVAVFGAGGGTFAVADPLDRGQESGSKGAVEAPMPGRVTAVYVSAGDRVAGGQKMAVLEAMKMEHALVAPRDGVIAEVLVSEGAQIEAGAALVRLQEEET